MPKLDPIHIASRLTDRLAQLISGEEVAARDIRALLTDEQIAALDEAKQQQKQLKKLKRARTKEQEAELGWKSIRQMHIEAVEAALKAAQGSEVEELERQQVEAAIRQARIYLHSKFGALEDNKPNKVAENIANNDLTRAGLRRLDGRGVGQRIHKRDLELAEIERQLLQQAKGTMKPEEFERLRFLEEHNTALLKTARRQGK